MGRDERQTSNWFASVFFLRWIQKNSFQPLVIASTVRVCSVGSVFRRSGVNLLHMFEYFEPIVLALPFTNIGTSAPFRSIHSNRMTPDDQFDVGAAVAVVDVYSSMLPSRSCVDELLLLWFCDAVCANRNIWFSNRVVASSGFMRKRWKLWNVKPKTFSGHKKLLIFNSPLRSRSASVFGFSFPNEWTGSHIFYDFRAKRRGRRAVVVKMIWSY